MKIQIKHRFTNDVIFEAEAASVGAAVLMAVEQKVSLVGADLSYQNMGDLNLVRASFDGASFDEARFDGASFVGASFVGASFVGASFVEARFVRASFVGASFVGASFVGASFDEARFDGASFVEASFDGASFVRASFVGASFVRASFDGASFVEASFVEASFDGASFVEASFVGARFDGASFNGASFVEASFDGASFNGASFVGARFVGARFDGASFVGARFDGASFDEKTARSLGSAWFSAKADLWMTLLSAPLEVPGLLAAVREGRIDGSQYTGTCACLVGTLANIRGCNYEDFRPDANRPAERWFMGISKGQTPDNHPISKITAEWIEEWHELFTCGAKAVNLAAA